MDTVPAHPRIPYGDSDFRRIRLNRWLYVDKTRFLRRLEQERYVFLIRPRRFGTSLWVSLLANYYDRRWGHEFDAVFDGTDIGRNPTAERHRYVVLRFDFSAVDDAIETLEREFDTYCTARIRQTLDRYPDLFPAAAARRILDPVSTPAKLNELFLHAGHDGIPLYVLIDEYDAFVINALARHDCGFFRTFFATLKAGTAYSAGGIERLFITGGLPINVDGVTGGFNIGTDISLNPDFNQMVGFTETEVRRLLETCRDLGVFDQDIDTAMGTMGEWYGGYRFAAAAEIDLYHTAMVLSYLDRSMPNRAVTDDVIDTNAGVDDAKLRPLLVAGRRPNDNFDLLRDIIGGEEVVVSRIQSSLPLERLAEPENFVSLLHYFGLLSIRDAVHGMPRLAIPNQTVKRLMHGYLRDAHCEAHVSR